MAKLNQIIAIEKGIKSGVYAETSALHNATKKPELFNGFSKTYQANDEAGEKLPPESKRVQFSSTEVLRTVERHVSKLMAVTARKDWTNCVAKGTVTVNGQELIKDVPVTYLLFLEKQLNDVHTFVMTLPVLDIAEDWTLDTHSGLYKTGEAKTHRTKKTQKPIVKYDATKEHPAQTEMITEDVISGYWTLIKQSGALPKLEKESLLERIEKLLRAVKEAREAANIIDEVTSPDVGALIFGFLLAV